METSLYHVNGTVENHWPITNAQPTWTTITFKQYAQMLRDNPEWYKIAHVFRRGFGPAGYLP